MSATQAWASATCLIVGAALSLAATGWMLRFAARRGFLDRPGGHKGHERPVPLGGGVAITAAIVGPILLGFVFILLVSRDNEAPAWLPEFVRRHVPGLLSRTRAAAGIVTGAILLHFLGIIDDKRQLGPWLKLSVPTAVATLLTVAFGVRLLSALNSWMPAGGEALSILVTIVWIVLITNAFNFLDNMDGLSAGVAAITSAIFGLAAIQVGQIFVPALAFLVTGSVLGYLWFNFPPAKIFMGDAGSLVIGYFMAVVTILPTYWDGALSTRPVGLLIPFVVLGVPLYDTASVVIIRLRRGVSPFQGDQRHFSHRLVQKGMKPRNAVLTIYLATAATGCGALLLPHASWLQAAAIVTQCLCVVAIIAILERVAANANG